LPNQTDLYIGLMSGTSLDGVDAILADFSGCNASTSALPNVIATYFTPYSNALRGKLLALNQPSHNELEQAALLGNELAQLYHQSVADLLEKAQIAASAVAAIGCHGQTIRHQPQAGYTLQLGNPALLAELSGIRVIADFRSRDIAAGGQGAPLVPAFHDAVFRDPTLHRVILNIGGISNITDLQPESPTRGFDCGPGNILLDAWIQKQLAQNYDKEGAWATTGHVIPALFNKLKSHQFFEKVPPKSCGREEFNLLWLEAHLTGNEDTADVQATLLELTASSINNAIGRWCVQPTELLVCGGGAKNNALLVRLKALMPTIRTQPTDAIGIGTDWVEALAFAWLARQTLLGLPGNLPEVTGASGHRVLGAIYPA